MSGVDLPLPFCIRPARLLAVCIGFFLCANSHAADWSLSDLMHLLAQQKVAKASFVEKKYIGILDKALESSGELFFEAPDRLEKRTLKPRLESLLLDGDKLTVTRYEKRPINLRLQDHPEIATVVESIRSTLSGDMASLEKNYTIDLAGAQGKWQLTLAPVQVAVAKIVRRVYIGGAEANIKTITFDQADGDRVEMTISAVVAP